MGLSFAAVNRFLRQLMHEAHTANYREAGGEVNYQRS
jgi:hypothetical protein